jgi:large-conductance mechanosensitive channel
MDTGKFHDFISKSNLFATAIAFLVSTQIIQVVNAVFDNLVSPAINYGLSRNKYPKLKDYIITIDDINFEIGAFLLTIIKFIFIILIIYFFITHFNIEIKED